MIIKELFAKLGLDIDDSGFKKADALIYGIKFSIAALGGLLASGAAGLGAMVMHTSEVADSIDETAQAAGITTDALQELAYAASFSGMNADAMAGALTKLTRNMSAAAEGGDEQAKAFAKVGVSVKNADGTLRDAGDVMQDLAGHFKEMDDGADKTALAVQLFGKSGASMIPFLNAGSDGIAELRDEAHGLGMVMSNETIKSGAELDDTLTRLKASATGMQYTIAGPLMASVNDYGKALLEWIKANRELIRQRVEKVVSILKFFMSLLLTVLLSMAKVLGVVIDNWKFLAAVLASVVLTAVLLNIGALGTLIWTYGAASAAAVASAIRMGAAWLVATAPISALVLILLALILVVEDLWTAFEGGDSILKAWLGDETINYWKEQLTKFWEWMTDGWDKRWRNVKRGFKGLFGIVDDTETSADMPEGEKYGFKEDTWKGPGSWKRLGNKGELRFFPDNPQEAFGNGEGPEQGASGSGPGGSRTTLAQAIHAPTIIQVTPPLGTSASDVADEVKSKFDESMQSTLEDAAAGF